MSSVPTIRQILEAEAEVFDSIGGGSSLIRKMVLKHGVSGSGVKHKHKRGKMGECFKNAAEAAIFERFTYVEGFAARASLAIPIHHAWVLDAEGRVIDLTWKRAEECTYIGIPFTDTVLRRELMKNRVYGLLSVGEMVNMELMREIDAELVDAAMDAMSRALKRRA